MSLLNHNTSPNVGQLKNIYNMLSKSSNPQAMLAEMAQKDPNIAWVMQMCKNGNPKDLFYALCKQRGVNPDDILNQLK